MGLRVTLHTALRYYIFQTADLWQYKAVGCEQLPCLAVMGEAVAGYVATVQTVTGAVVQSAELWI